MIFPIAMPREPLTLTVAARRESPSTAARRRRLRRLRLGDDDHRGPHEPLPLRVAGLHLGDDGPGRVVGRLDLLDRLVDAGVERLPDRGDARDALARRARRRTAAAPSAARRPPPSRRVARCALWMARSRLSNTGSRSLQQLLAARLAARPRPRVRARLRKLSKSAAVRSSASLTRASSALVSVRSLAGASPGSAEAAEADPSPDATSGPSPSSPPPSPLARFASLCIGRNISRSAGKTSEELSADGLGGRGGRGVRRSHLARGRLSSSSYGLVWPARRVLSAGLVRDVPSRPIDLAVVAGAAVAAGGVATVAPWQVVGVASCVLGLAWAARRADAATAAVVVVFLAVGLLRGRRAIVRHEEHRALADAAMPAPARCSARATVDVSPVEVRETLRWDAALADVTCEAQLSRGTVRATLYGGPDDLARGDESRRSSPRSAPPQRLWDAATRRPSPLRGAPGRRAHGRHARRPRRAPRLGRRCVDRPRAGARCARGSTRRSRPDVAPHGARPRPRRERPGGGRRPRVPRERALAPARGLGDAPGAGPRGRRARAARGAARAGGGASRRASTRAGSSAAHRRAGGVGLRRARGRRRLDGPRRVDGHGGARGAGARASHATRRAPSGSRSSRWPSLDPLVAFDLSFALSAGATAGLLAFARPLRPQPSRRRAPARVAARARPGDHARGDAPVRAHPRAVRAHHAARRRPSPTCSRSRWASRSRCRSASPTRCSAWWPAAERGCAVGRVGGARPRARGRARLRRARAHRPRARSPRRGSSPRSCAAWPRSRCASRIRARGGRAGRGLAPAARGRGAPRGGAAGRAARDVPRRRAGRLRDRRSARRRRRWSSTAGGSSAAPSTSASASSRPSSARGAGATLAAVVLTHPAPGPLRRARAGARRGARRALWDTGEGEAEGRRRRLRGPHRLGRGSTARPASCGRATFAASGTARGSAGRGARSVPGVLPRRGPNDNSFVLRITYGERSHPLRRRRRARGGGHAARDGDGTACAPTCSRSATTAAARRPRPRSSPPSPRGGGDLGRAAQPVRAPAPATLADARGRRARTSGAPTATERSR